MYEEKVSILCPTYNDVGFLPGMIESVREQTYQNWQLIIVNDGSTDNTRAYLDSLADTRIQVLHQDNADQLQALTNGAKHVDGDYVCMLHSDDRLFDELTIERNLHQMEPGIEGLIADYQLLDRDGNRSGRLPTFGPNTSEAISKIWYEFGGNPLGDHFFVSREFFESHVVPNYLHNNTLYYLDLLHRDILPMKKVSPWYGYRVYYGNYINSDLGKFVALMGQFRTMAKLFEMGLCNQLWGTDRSVFGFKLLRKLKKSAPVSFQSKPGWKSMARYFCLWQQQLIKDKYPTILSRVAGAISRTANLRSLGVETVLEFDGFLECELNPTKGRALFPLFQEERVDALYFKMLETDFTTIRCRKPNVSRVEHALNFFSLPARVDVSR